MGKILDNKNHGTVGDTLKEAISEGSKLSFISSCFTIYAYRELKSQLESIDELRFLFVEPAFVKDISKKETREYEINRSGREQNLTGTEFEIRLKNELQQGAIAKECAEWLKAKVKMRSFTDSAMEPAKLYHVEGNKPCVIHGNSDFTADGLGFVPSRRFFSNIYSDDAELSRNMLKQFDEFWHSDTLTEDVKTKVLDSLLTVYKENPPEFLYYVTLYNIFKTYLEELDEDTVLKTKTGFKQTLIWNKLYKFQKDGALGAIDKLEKHNGCIIADSVGLGKTFEALAVIKYYELRNNRVLVLCPKKLRDNWLVYKYNDKRNILLKDRFNYDVLNHTDLSRYTGISGDINLEMLNWDNYDLLVIDESHNFRNNDPRKDHETRYARLMNKIIKQGVKTKVLMLSATPVNNRMNDLKNQVVFITEGNDHSFSEEGISSIEQTLKTAQARFNKWCDKPEKQRTLDTFLEMINFDYFKLLDIATIARSRKHIQKYYDMSEIGEFPERLKPDNIYSDIDLSKEFPPLKEINRSIRLLNLGAYSPLKYVLPAKQKEYSEKYDVTVKDGNSVWRQIDREENLIGLMRVNLLKRMESSIFSFALTVERILMFVDSLLEKIKGAKGVYETDLSIVEIETDDAELEDKLIGNKVKVLLQDIDTIRWKQDLKADKKILEELLSAARAVTPKRDAKLKILKDRIIEKVSSTPYNVGNKKILLFTAFADTAGYLYRNIADWLKTECGVESALVTGSVENKSTLKMKHRNFSAILTLFSPISKEKEKIFPEISGEIDLIIASDCISEGQNLQDCDCVISYDIHWNPVRIIQRFGRIDRLGSVNAFIKLINFWPNLELDEYINLEARVKGRMVLLDVSATGDENIIEEDAAKKMNDLEYRKKQLKRLQEEVVDLEEISGGISITDMTFNDFRMDLHDYAKENERLLEQSLTGIHSVVALDPALKEHIGPGVLFCLRQIQKTVKSTEVNALYPYCLVYVQNDGTVRQGYIHPKRNLDIFKKLCTGKKEVLHDIVKVFNEETDNGKNMEHYSGLLDEAVKNICNIEEEQGVASLFSGGGTNIKGVVKNKDDFELITFLVVR